MPQGDIKEEVSSSVKLGNEFGRNFIFRYTLWLVQKNVCSKCHKMFAQTMLCGYQLLDPNIFGVYVNNVIIKLSEKQPTD